MFLYMYSVPGPVSNLSVVPGVFEVKISWNPPSERNGIIVVYELGFTIGADVNFINTSDTQYTLRDLPPGSLIITVVRAYTVTGPGNFSDIATSTNMDVRKCIITYLYKVRRICQCSSFKMKLLSIVCGLLSL